MIVLHFPLVFVYTHSSDSLKYQSMGDTLYFAMSFIAATGVLATIGLLVQRRIVSYILRYILMHLHVRTCILSLSLVINSYHIYWNRFISYMYVSSCTSYIFFTCIKPKKVLSIMIQHYTAF